jgi:hypothetical protein
MRRLEVIANQSVQEEIIEGLAAVVPGFQYTLLAPAYGAGMRRKKLGSVVWPEVNFVLVSYMDEAGAVSAREFLADLKGRFPDEGIAFFDIGG